jgi:hypothetical protein
MIDESMLIPYPMGSDPRNPPTAIALSQFHYFLNYKNKISAICVLNGEIAHEDILHSDKGDADNGLLDLVADGGTFWTYDSHSIFELIINNEEANIWKLFLEKKQFDTALRYAKVSTIKSNLN